MIAWLASLFDWQVFFVVQRDRDLENLGWAVLQQESRDKWDDGGLVLASWAECQRAGRRFLGMA